VINYPHPRAKVTLLSQTPYDRTIFLDADTYICGDLDSMFDLLDKFDLAIAHDTFRSYVRGNTEILKLVQRIPGSFPMFNSGVIAFKKTQAVRQFLEKWQSLYERDSELDTLSGKGFCQDQPPFREALYYSNVHFTVLPTEYNCRFIHPVFLNEKVKVLHGPSQDYVTLEAEINRRLGNRVFLPKTGLIHEKDIPAVFTRWYWKHRMNNIVQSTKRWPSQVRSWLLS